MLALAYSLTLLSARTRAGLGLQKQVYAISPRQVNKHGVVPSQFLIDISSSLIAVSDSVYTSRQFAATMQLSKCTKYSLHFLLSILCVVLSVWQLRYMLNAAINSL